MFKLDKVPVRSTSLSPERDFLTKHKCFGSDHGRFSWKSKIVNTTLRKRSHNLVSFVNIIYQATLVPMGMRVVPGAA